jgi:uncharacterized protein YueI
MKNLSTLATEVVAQLDKDQLEKQAQVTYTNAQSLKTETGKMLVKVAELLRIESQAKITYTDLARFRKTYGIAESGDRAGGGR